MAKNRSKKSAVARKGNKTTAKKNTDNTILVVNDSDSAVVVPPMTRAASARRRNAAESQSECEGTGAHRGRASYGERHDSDVLLSADEVEIRLPICSSSSTECLTGEFDRRHDRSGVHRPTGETVTGPAIDENNRRSADECGDEDRTSRRALESNRDNANRIFDTESEGHATYQGKNKTGVLDVEINELEHLNSPNLGSYLQQENERDRSNVSRTNEGDERAVYRSRSNRVCR